MPDIDDRWEKKTPLFDFKGNSLFCMKCLNAGSPPPALEVLSLKGISGSLF